MTSYLKSPIEFLKGVGPKRAETLNKELGIFTFEDLLNHFPFRYVDKTKVYKIIEINPQTQFVRLEGKLSAIRIIGSGRGKRLQAIFQDDSGGIECIWFKGINYLQKQLKSNVPYSLFGKPTWYKGKPNFAHPELEVIENNLSFQASAFEAVYPSTETLKSSWLNSKGILKLQRNLWEGIKEHDLPEFLPPSLLKKYRLTDRVEAFRNIHFPNNSKQVLLAQRRLKFEELFLLQLKILKSKVEKRERSNGKILKDLKPNFTRFFEEVLPFELTGAQKRVLKEIRKDILSGKQMNRLLQGDVGSGKTVVALMCLLMAVDNGAQAALMAPTEILAKQHFIGISEELKELNLNLALLTGSNKSKSRNQTLEELKEGKVDIIFGTHALLEDRVQFKDLAMVVIDEQHRFGVAQRAKLQIRKTTQPHVLVMTATPIPRTLAMTLYGDLEVSVIDELPAGRKPIETVHKRESHRLWIHGFMKKQIALGRQVYVVYPLIEESASLDLANLMEGYEAISRAFPIADYKVSIVHGRMKSAEKDKEMKRFAMGETQILIGTTVIEVGINVPNASVMVIENAERFGLSQLHQLRGRVGRGAEQSYCLLVSGNKLSAEAKKRIETMVATNDGFKIAEVDLEIRGPGNILGTKQSGDLNLKIANLAQDQAILQEAKKSASEILKADPDLNFASHSALKLFLKSSPEQTDWSKVS